MPTEYDNVINQAKQLNQNMMGGFGPPQTGSILNNFIVQALSQAPMGLRPSGIQPMMRDINIAQQKMKLPEKPNIAPYKLEHEVSKLPPGMEAKNNKFTTLEYPLEEHYMRGGMRPKNDDPMNIHNKFENPEDAFLNDEILNSLSNTKYQEALKTQQLDRELINRGYSKEIINTMSYLDKQKIIEGN